MSPFVGSVLHRTDPAASHFTKSSNDNTLKGGWMLYIAWEEGKPL